jgi:hypothetical protein
VADNGREEYSVAVALPAKWAYHQVHPGVAHS